MIYSPPEIDASQREAVCVCVCLCGGSGGGGDGIGVPGGGWGVRKEDVCGSAAGNCLKNKIKSAKNNDKNLSF